MSFAHVGRVPFPVVGIAALVGLAVAPPPLADGQPSSYASRSGLSPEQRMAETLREVEAIKARLARIEAEADSLAGKQDAIKARLTGRTRALYRITRAGMLPLVGGLGAMLDHMGRVQRMERLVRGDLDDWNKLRIRQSALRDEARRLKEDLGDADALYARLESERAAANPGGGAVRFEDAFQSSTFSPGRRLDDVGFGGIRVLDEGPTGLESDFAALRGRLELPVTGDFRATETDVGEGPAMRFETASGATVRAAAEGRVAFADRHESYGLLVIVDHGDNYYTVYGGLARTEVRVGDYVGPRARVGTVGSEALVFEVRKGTRSLPPRPWLGF